MGIYDNIRNVAKNKGISINKLEKELKFPRGSMYKYDKSTPSASKLGAIAEYLGCSVDELLGNNSDAVQYYTDPETESVAEEAYQNKRMHLLFNAQKGASDEAVMKAVNFLEALKMEEQFRGKID